MEEKLYWVKNWIRKFFFIKSVRDQFWQSFEFCNWNSAKGIVLSHDRSLLFENGGHIELTKSFEKNEYGKA